MLYSTHRPNNIDLTQFEGKIVIEVNARNEMDNDSWSLSPHHGKEGIWYRDDNFNLPVELKPFRILDDGTKLYEIHVNPSVPKDQIKRHHWIIQYWNPRSVSLIDSISIIIGECYNEPWDLTIHGMTIKGMLLNENVVSNIHNV